MRTAFDISRRRLLLSLPVLAMAPRAFAQAGKPPIPVRGFNHVTIRVFDVKRSTDFYQGLFGMPNINPGSESADLQIGSGPQCLELAAAGAEAPNISHICL